MGKNFRTDILYLLLNVLILAGAGGVGRCNNEQVTHAYELKLEERRQRGEKQKSLPHDLDRLPVRALTKTYARTPRGDPLVPKGG